MRLWRRSTPYLKIRSRCVRCEYVRGGGRLGSGGGSLLLM